MEMKKTRKSSDLFGCATLILPYLPPPALLSLAASCRTLRSIIITYDASRGIEKFPIPFVNNIDSVPYFFFLYTRSSLAPNNVIFGSGCDCISNCNLDPTNCDCVVGDSRSDSGLEMRRECGEKCGCGLDCVNRITQRGVSVKLKIIRVPNKGWGLFAAEFVKKGRFICEYAGEYLTTEESRKRQKVYDELASKKLLSPALIVIREHLPSGKACLRVNIDATKIGNVGRFINHSCGGGNLTTVLVRNVGSLLPRLCFYAAVDINDGSELTFSYGEGNLRENGSPCFCGSSDCCGVLPSEDT